MTDRSLAAAESGRAPAGDASSARVIARLSAIDRYLPLWIFGAIGLGLAVGHRWPGFAVHLDAARVGGVSAPIALGLFWMMYPVLARVRYESIGQHARNTRLLGTSLVLNWIIGPVVMFVLAWLFLPDLPEYRNGLILIGLVRCIAMVLIWNSLACGSNELAAMLVALNSIFQILTYSLLGWLFLTIVPGWLGLPGAELTVTMWDIARSVLLFLGVPLLAGYVTRRGLVSLRGVRWYDDVFMPKFGPTALLGLLYTIVLMFAMQGDRIISLPFDVLRIALPLAAYFAIMFGSSMALARRLGFAYDESASLSFTAAGNNFELAIAVAIATFGLGSGEALAAVVGPLIEVPALVALVYVALWARRYFPGPVATAPTT